MTAKTDIITNEAGSITRVLPLSARAQLFVSPDHRSILYPGAIGEQLYSKDGEIFRAVRNLAFYGSADLHHVSFEDLHDGCTRRDVWRRGNLVLLGSDVLGRKMCTHKGNPDEGKPFITVADIDLVLDLAALARHGLTEKDVFENTPGTIELFDYGLNAVLLMDATEMRRAPCPDQVTYLPCLSSPGLNSCQH